MEEPGKSWSSKSGKYYDKYYVYFFESGLKLSAHLLHPT
jgi:hypothetical protein